MVRFGLDQLPKAYKQGVWWSLQIGASNMAVNNRLIKHDDCSHLKTLKMDVLLLAPGKLFEIS